MGMTLSKRLFALALLATSANLVPAVASADPPAQAAPERKWEKLGERGVDAKLDHDAIAIGRDDGVFDAVQLKVEGSSLVMFDVKITFGNGETFEPKTRLVFDQNAKSRVIDLPGNKRAIKRVDFKFANLPGGGKARVELWGRDLPAAPPPPAWKPLGQREVDGKADRDALTVDDGAYTAIQLKVENSSLVMSDVKIVFNNGESFDPNVRLVFDQNTKSRVIDLPGNKRGIRRIEFKYGNLPGGGRAKVEVSGR